MADIITGKLKEKTTWAGLAFILGALGIHVNPEYLSELIEGTMHLAGLVMVLFKEAESKNGNE